MNSIIQIISELLLGLGVEAGKSPKAPHWLRVMSFVLVVGSCFVFGVWMLALAIPEKNTIISVLGALMLLSGVIYAAKNAKNLKNN